MYKYPSGHKYHRSETDLAQDMALVLTSKFKLKTKMGFINSILWGWSERFGKYKGLPCSEAAMKEFKQHGSKNLRHDHMVPRNLLVKMCLEMRNVTSSKILNLLKKFGGAAILTADEDKKLNKLKLRQKMPKSWNHRDPYARYKAARIKLSKRSLG